MAEGRSLQLPRRSQRLSEPETALVEIAPFINERNESRRDPGQLGSQPREPVEAFFRGRVAQTRPQNRIQPLPVCHQRSGKRGQPVRHGEGRKIRSLEGQCRHQSHLNRYYSRVGLKLKERCVRTRFVEVNPFQKNWK